MKQHICLWAGLGLLLTAGQSYGQTLVAEYLFDNPVTLGMDTSGFGNHAVNANVSPATDRNGNPNMAGAFSGNTTTSVLTVAGGLNGYDGLPGFSFAAWVNRSSADASFSGIVSQDPAGGACCTNRLLLDPGDNPYVDAGAHVDFDFGNHVPPIVAPNDQWFHIVMTADDTGPGNTVDIYIDGSFAGSHTFAHNLIDGSALDTFIGTGENGNAHPFDGLLDDVQIFDGALNADQVSLLFRTGSIVPEPATIAIWSALGLAMAAGVGLNWRRKRKK